MLEMEKPLENRKKISKVEETKRITRLSKKLFPQHTSHPELGELIFLVRAGGSMGCTEKQTGEAGNWWLWIRSLFIENTMTKQMKRKMRLTALQAAKFRQPIHFVSTRSPELIHAQISTQGDSHLPRSRKALQELSVLIRKSSIFLPTIGTVLLANIAIDNIEAIKQVCPDTQSLIEKNHHRLEEIAAEEHLSNISITRLSELPHPSGKEIGDLINLDGTVNLKIEFSPKAERKILIASKESLESHQKMFGWSETQSREHNRNLAKTMALVGQAVNVMQPPAILIHNEAFISRGALNNLLTDTGNPLPVICLASLLNRKG